MVEREKDLTFPGKYSIQAILLIRAGALGDLILTFPALSALRRRFPQARVDIWGYPTVAEIALRCGYADRTESIEDRKVGSLFVRGEPLPGDLKEYLRRLDLALAYTFDEDGTLRENLERSGVRHIVIHDPFPRAGERVHETEHLLGALKSLGIEGADPTPRVAPDNAAEGFADTFWREHSLENRYPVVAIHPGSGGKKKIWPPDRFARLADYLAETYGAEILLVVGPIDRSVSEKVQEDARAAHIIPVENVGLVELAAILRRCDAYVGNDSGVTHLAAAVRTPTIAIFGPTDPAVWGPRGENVVIVRKEEGNLEAIAVEDVLSIFPSRGIL
ncbi:MAG: glycosyltransferase family 9 protein [bacterium]